MVHGVQTRLRPAERRAQLVALGMRQLATRPLDELSVDDIAAQAGTSPGLLFHYFGSKRGFHLALLQETAVELLHCTEPNPRLQPTTRLRTSIEAFVAYVRDHPQAYLALIRAVASGDAAMRAVFEETRTVLTGRLLTGVEQFDITIDPRLHLAIRGWIAFTEEIVTCWIAGSPLGLPALLDLCERSFYQVLLTGTDQQDHKLITELIGENLTTEAL
jgi:AcrR family transcriptional regulator